MWLPSWTSCADEVSKTCRCYCGARIGTCCWFELGPRCNLKISDIERDYREHHGLVDDDGNLPADVSSMLSINWMMHSRKMGLLGNWQCSFLYGQWPLGQCHGCEATFKESPGLGLRVLWPCMGLVDYTENPVRLLQMPIKRSSDRSIHGPLLISF